MGQTTGLTQSADAKAATAHLKKVYGLEPGDIGLEFYSDFDIEEVERLAIKYDLDRREDFMLGDVKPSLRKAFGI